MPSMAGTLKTNKTREMLYMFLHPPTGEPARPVPEHYIQGGMLLLANSPLDFNLKFEDGDDLCRSAELSDVIKEGTRSGCIAEPAAGDRPEYVLSEEGRGMAEGYWQDADKQIKDFIIDVKEILDGMTYEELVLFMAVSFPKHLHESEIYKKFADVRMDVACSLFKKDKGTIAKCAAIAGLPYQDFVTVLLDRGIEPYEVTKEDEERVMKTIDILA